jgi:1-phosphatidylinositol-3-phosphate 5-kinase
VPSSKLPRRQVRHPSVAELVKKYSEYLPPQGVEELAKTALSPHLDTAESEQESATRWPKPPSGRNRLKRSLARRPSTSDFESSYAANVAPRYLTHSRRHARQPSLSSRIPGPVNSSSHTSRQQSPEKPLASADSDAGTKHSLQGKGLASSVVGRSATPRQGRNLGKDRAQPRAASGTIGKGLAARRGVLPPGNRVTSIARHFERITKDNDRANRRYAVIRGRRARPVASSLATVEVLDSVKDAIQDESESSDSSEADDEGGDDEDTHKSPDKDKISPEATGTVPTHRTDESKDSVPAQPPELNASPSPGNSQGISSESPLISRRSTLTSGPSSPSLSSSVGPRVPIPSPLYDLDYGAPGHERHSLLKALSGFWPQNVPHRDETDDPIRDPEHIFRDSSMVVRTDEPTSIIALALRQAILTIVFISSNESHSTTVLCNIVKCSPDPGLRSANLESHD